jgi:hypothetical protein
MAGCHVGEPIASALRCDRGCGRGFPFPRSKHPHLAEDPGALAAAHLKCNQRAGERPPAPGLGVLSEDW